MEDSSRPSDAGRVPHSRWPTLQQAHRATAILTLKTSAPLFSFKRNHCKTEVNGQTRVTIPAASREQVVRLYAGPTVRSAGAWDAPLDGPGPQAYKADPNFIRRTPSALFSVAKRERDSTPLPSAPGPGDYDAAHPAIGEEGRRSMFGDPKKRGRYPPRTLEQPRAQVACSYAEHVSCLGHQVTSDRMRSPTFCFDKAVRFKENSVSRRDIPTKITPVSPQKPLDPWSPSSIPIAHSTISRRKNPRRSKCRGSRRPRVFRRADYGWLINCMQPKQLQPRLKLTDNRPPSIDPSKARALTETEAPRAVFRLGPRFNPAEYNPQRRDLPRETDVLPGPKYDRPPGAFGRTGGGGGTVARSASVSRSDRFPRRRLFPEEEISKRQDTPGPGTYNNKKVCLGEKTRSLGTLASPLAGTVGGGDGCEEYHDDDHQRFSKIVKRRAQNARAGGAPAFTFGGGGARDLSSRLLYIPGETIYKEVRLGKSGPGPSTAVSRSGERLTRPRLRVARIIRLGEAGSARISPENEKRNLLEDSAFASGEAIKGGAEGARGYRETVDWVVDGALGVQVKSGRPTRPSFKLAGPRRAVDLFHERLRYGGKELSSSERNNTEPRRFFDSHLPRSTSDAHDAAWCNGTRGMNAPSGASSKEGE